MYSDMFLKFSLLNYMLCSSAIVIRQLDSISYYIFAFYYHPFSCVCLLYIDLDKSIKI
jgi:hypothetical protein